MNISLTVDGHEKFNWAVDSLSKSITDWRGAWPAVEQVFYRAQLEQFESEGVRGGKRWKPLRNWYKEKYPNRRILDKTGKLKRSFTVAGSDGQILDRQPMSLRIGSSVFYGKFHQRGTRKMAARPPMQLLQRDMGRIISRMYRFAWLQGQIAGFKTQGRSFLTPGAE